MIFSGENYQKNKCFKAMEWILSLTRIVNLVKVLLDTRLKRLYPAPMGKLFASGIKFIQILKSKTENLFVAFGAIGEGFHNYHHTFPQDYSTSEFGCKTHTDN